ncbi:MAG: DUF1853 family protein [Cellvibrionaceae bacterium]|nr:DUF1853 family protein [Cellvibrionaceae bacterium]
MTFKQFKHRAVRDLAWLLYEPSLLKSIPQQAQLLDFSLVDPNVIPWLEQQALNPEPLIDHLRQRTSKRIGLYAEHLLTFYFSHYPRFDLLTHNLQIHNQQRTLGELDFMIIDKYQKKTYHLELAVKFYLGQLTAPPAIKHNTPIYNWHHWIGPNKKDTLAIKMRHLLTHQLKLTQTAEAQQKLKVLQINTHTITTRLVIKGGLYFPCATVIPAARHSLGSVPKKNWFDITQMTNNQLISNHSDIFCILPRHYWLSAITQEDYKEGLLEFHTKTALQNKVHAEHLQGVNTWHIAQIATDKNIQEIKRFFVIGHGPQSHGKP